MKKRYEVWFIEEEDGITQGRIHKTFDNDDESDFYMMQLLTPKWLKGEGKNIHFEIREYTGDEKGYLIMFQSGDER